jgi:hypothetical protein
MTLTFTPEIGRVIIERENTQMIITHKGEAHWAGLCLMAQGRREECGALLAAYYTAWPEPVPPPNALAVTPNFTIDEVKP